MFIEMLSFLKGKIILIIYVFFVGFNKYETIFNKLVKIELLDLVMSVDSN